MAIGFQCLAPNFFFRRTKPRATSSEDDHPGTTGANPAIADPETSEELFVLSLSRIPVLKFYHFTMVVIVVHAYVWQRARGQAPLHVICPFLSSGSKRESSGLRIPARSPTRPDLVPLHYRLVGKISNRRPRMATKALRKRYEGSWAWLAYREERHDHLFSTRIVASYFLTFCTPSALSNL